MPDFVTPVQLFAACKIIAEKKGLNVGFLKFRRGDTIGLDEKAAKRRIGWERL